MLIVVKSYHRSVQLEVPEDPGRQSVLLVPVGTSDRQVLEWAADLMKPEHVAALALQLEREHDP
jgi:hypothetical protein